jgi:hypothetical protein
VVGSEGRCGTGHWRVLVVVGFAFSISDRT